MSEKELRFLCSPQIKIIFTDLDGTLLSPKRGFWGKVRTFTLSAINGFLDGREHHLILATGRNIRQAKEISNGLETRFGGYKIPYLICLNGGVLYNNIEKKIIYSKSFKCSQLLKLLQFLRRHFVVFHLIVTEQQEIYTEDQGFARAIAKKFAKKYDADLKISSPENYQKGGGSIQKIILITLHKNSDEMRLLIESKFSEFYVATSGDGFLEIIDKKINKFSAIKSILKLEGGVLSECCGIGNEHNDVSMIENCGFGVAVDFKRGKNFKFNPNLINFYTTNSDGKAVARAINKFCN